jgi:hypothetical protein
MPGPAHHIVSERSALNVCIMPDSGSQPACFLALRRLGAGLTARVRAVEYDVAGSPHRFEVGAPCKNVVAVGDPDCNKAKAARARTLLIAACVATLIELRRYDRMSRMARSEGLREI